MKSARLYYHRDLMLNLEILEYFWNDLFDWHEYNCRNYPWRDTKDPFAILVAEKLLQQTTVRNIVVTVYCEILNLYPNPQALACASVAKLEELIQPLGLVYRSKELKQMAKELTECYSSQVPQNMEDLLELTGVGHYSARAVMSFAFEADQR